MLSVNIREASDKKSVDVTEEGAILVNQLTYPPLGQNKAIPFRQYLTTDGMAANGTNEDMTVDGSVNNVDFFIPAADNRDRYITALSFLLEGDGAKLKDFCAADPLTVGCRLFFFHPFAGEVDINDSLKSNWEFVRLAGGNPPFGSGGDVFKAKDVFAKIDAYIPVVDLRVMSPGIGVKLDSDTLQRLTFRIKDDLTVLNPSRSSFIYFCQEILE